MRRKRFYILSVDGGGLKGLIAIKILQIIAEVSGKKITELFDLMGGTSTGGLIVSALTVCDHSNVPLHDLDYVENMYLDAGHKLFKQNGLNGSEARELNDMLERTVDGQKIADTAVPIFVPTYDLATHKVIVFKTRSAILNEAKNARLFDVCRATSAIPPVFPAHTLRYNHKTLTCIDAGYHIKNPAVAVLAEFWKHKAYYGGGHLKEEDVVLVSISTGNFSGNNKDWSTNINEILATQHTAAEYIRQQKLEIDLGKVNFLRVDLSFAGGSGYSVQKLIEISNKLEALSQDKAFTDTVTGLLK